MNEQIKNKAEQICNYWSSLDKNQMRIIFIKHYTILIAEAFDKLNNHE